MPIINKVSASVFDLPKPVGRQPSPQQLELMRWIKGLRNERSAFEVILDGDEKATTIRQQIARASKATGIEVAVKRSPGGFYVGLMTADRQRGGASKAAGRS